LARYLLASRVFQTLIVMIDISKNADRLSAGWVDLVMKSKPVTPVYASFPNSFYTFDLLKPQRRVA
jgi:hypothetical protein